MIVVDASVMVEILLCTELGGRAADRVLSVDGRHAPNLIDAEVAQVLRRFVLAEQVTAGRAMAAIEDLALFPMRRHAHTSLLERVFELRSTLTAYDALYVSLAEALGAPLLTSDTALARAPGKRAKVELLQ